MSRFDYAGYFGRVRDVERFVLGRDEVAWTETYRPPEREVDVLLYLGCNVLLTAHLAREVVAVLRVLVDWTKRAVQVPGLYDPRRTNAYEQCVVAGPLVFVAGQVGWDAENRIVSLEFESQARQAFENVRACLSACCRTAASRGAARARRSGRPGRSSTRCGGRRRSPRPPLAAAR